MAKINRPLIHAKYDGHCAYCGSEITIKEMQVDHIQSKYHDGSDKEENLNPSCRACNFYKGAGDINLLRYDLQTLHKRLNKIFIVRLAIKYGILKLNDWDGKFYFEKEGVKE